MTRSCRLYTYHDALVLDSMHMKLMRSQWIALFKGFLADVTFVWLADVVYLLQMSAA